MAPSFNFKISSNGALSKGCLEKQLVDFQKVCHYIKQLPYGRNSDKKNLTLVLTEQKGTCSTKHAFLYEIARENNIEDIVLCIGIYKMSQMNTPDIGDILQKHLLDYIPEAHNYIKYHGVILDYTSSKAFYFKKYLLFEEQILPEQITDYKINMHKSYIKKWISEASIPYSLEEIWNIREQCILNLSQ